MLDKNSLSVLKVLNKLADADYKVVTIEEITPSITTKNQLTEDDVKHIMEFLFKQEYINIKFSEDNTYCYCILPKAKQLLEQNSSKKATKNKPNIINYLVTALSAFVGTILALIIFYFI